MRQDSTAEVLINQLQELGARRGRVQNKRRKLPGSFSGLGSISVVYFRLGRDSIALPRRTNRDTFTALRGS